MARQEDASTVDLMELLPRPLLRSNENGRIDFATSHWRKYFTRLDLLTEPEWAALAQYLCRQAEHEQSAVEPSSESKST
jgi:hypothetical protein